MSFPALIVAAFLAGGLVALGAREILTSASRLEWCRRKNRVLNHASDLLQDYSRVLALFKDTLHAPTTADAVAEEVRILNHHRREFSRLVKQ